MLARHAPSIAVVKRPPHRWAGALTALVFLVAATALARWQMSPPAALSADAAATSFSAVRAVQHLQSLAAAPHPPGTPAHMAVRQYIIGQFTAAGLTPEIQDATVDFDYGSTPVTMATVHNVMARLKGAGPGRPLVLAAHYDSTAGGPGASDDGIGVAVLLETLRALKAGPPLQNDVIFLITDGEELGLLGAKAWVKEHPWAQEAALFLNFEARGTTGPAFLFEVSSQNGELMRQVARAVPYATSNSMAYEVYRRMPNSTDVTVFKQLSGVAYLNVAPIGGWTRYHSMLDDISHVDQCTVQQMGEYALGVARQFGNAALPVARTGDVVWFSAFRWWLVQYPVSWALPFAVAVASAAAAALVFGFRRRALTGRQLALGLLPLPLSVVLVAGVLFLVQRWAVPWDAVRPDWFGPACYLGAFAATLAVFGMFRRWINTAASMAGAILWWTAGAVALSATIPGASFLLVWPLLFGVIGFVCLVFIGQERAESAPGVGLLSLCALPAILLVMPAVFFVYDGLNALPAAAAALLVLLLGLCAPHLGALSAWGRWWLPAGALLAAGGVVLASLWLAPDSFHPARDQLYYAIDADAGQAYWLSPGPKDVWTSRYVGAERSQRQAPEYFPYNSNYFWKAPASDPVSLPAPEAKVVDDKTEGGFRTLRLHITSPRQASLVGVYLPSSPEVVAASVDGRPFSYHCKAGDSCLPWSLTYIAPPAAGFEVTLKFAAGQSMPLRLIDRSIGLPPGTAPRPATLIPGWGSDWMIPSDSISVSRKYNL